MLKAKRVALCICLFLSVSITFSQTIEYNDEEIEKQVAETDSLFKKARFEQSLSLAQRHYQAFEASTQKNARWRVRLLIQLGMAAYYNSRYAGAIERLSKVLELLEEDKEDSHQLLAKAGSFLAMSYYRDSQAQRANAFVDSLIVLFPDDFNSVYLSHFYEVKALVYSDFVAHEVAEEWYTKARENRKLYLETDSIQYILSFIYDGNYQLVTGKTEAALASFRTAERWVERLQANEYYQGTVSYYLGRYYKEISQPERAISYIEKAEELYNKCFAPWHLSMIDVHESLANIYRDQGLADEGIAKHKQVIELMEEHYEKPPIELGVAYHNLGLIYSDLRDFTKADYYYRKAIVVLQRYSDADPGARNMLYLTLNSVINQLWYGGEYDTAKIKYQELIGEIEISLGEESLYLPQTLNNLGLTYSELSQFSEAEEQFTRGLDILGYRENATDPFSEMLSPIELQYVLWNRAENYLDWYNTTKEIEYLQMAQRDFKNSALFLDEMRKGFRTEGTKIGFAEENKVVYEYGIEVALLLYEIDKDLAHLKQAMSYAEKARSLLLLEIFRKNQVDSFSDLPESVREQEARLSFELEETEKAYYRELIRPLSNSDTLAKLAADLKKRKEGYYRLLDRLRIEHKDYYDLKYNPNVLALEDIQQQLLNDTTILLEYYFGASNNYLFLVTSDTIVVERLDPTFDPISATNDLLQNISRYNDKSRQAEKNKMAQQFDSLAHGLYRYLLEPLAKYPQAKHLILIPDGPLGELPFGVLLQKPSRRAGAFAHHDYLIKEYTLSYAYSATLFSAMLSQQKGKVQQPKWLGFAPEYLGKAIRTNAQQEAATPLTLSPLSYNEKELERIQDYLNGTTFLNKAATKAAFVEAVSEYNIIHFSGHADIDPKPGFWGFLAFHDYSDQADKVLLYIREIYSLDLSGAMVVLSGCNTTLGGYYPGEGIISLARAFAYAGAHGVVSSLWSVNDQSTTMLMSDFYKHLRAENYAANSALRNAKLEMIDQGGDIAHPFYWGGFIAIGNARNARE